MLGTFVLFAVAAAVGAFVLGFNVLLAACTSVLGPFAFLAADTTARAFGSSVLAFTVLAAISACAFVLGSTVLLAACTFVYGTFKYLAVADITAALAFGSYVLDSTVLDTFGRSHFEFLAIASDARALVLGSLVLCAVAAAARAFVLDVLAMAVLGVPALAAPLFSHGGDVLYTGHRRSPWRQPHPGLSATSAHAC